MEVEWTDQQKINEFSKLHGRLTSHESSEKQLKQRKEDLDDLEMEIELIDEDEKLLYAVGDSFVYLSHSEISEKLQEDKDSLEERIEALITEKEKVSSRLDELKAALYAKFGRENINLERE